MTVEQFFELPDDGRRYELLDGVVEEMTAPNIRHQRISLRLLVWMVHALQDSGRGEVFSPPCDVVLDEHSVLQPDAIFVATSSEGIVTERNLRGAPDVVVEILSESTRRKDVLRKRRLYARGGVSWYWILDPEIDRVEFLKRDGDDFDLVSIADAPATVEVPGFPSVRIDLAALFA